MLLTGCKRSKWGCIWWAAPTISVAPIKRWSRERDLERLGGKDRAPLWRVSSLIISGACRNCSGIKSLRRLGASRGDEDVRAHDHCLIPVCPSGHEGVRARDLWRIRSSPNDREAVLGRFL